NEAAGLAAIMEQARQLTIEGAQLVWVDGGSTDGTAQLLQAGGLQVVASQPGRALQMNTGAACVTSDCLLFLHADTTLPLSALSEVQRALSGRCVWGRFDVRIQGRSRWLPVVAFMMNMRSRCTGIATGDQALFMTRAAFDAVGGFPVQALMEDIDMSRKLKRLSAPACLRSKATTSGRRWDTCGAWRTILLMWKLRWAYWRGAAPDDIARAYR
ncbi:MAG: TIGR04283 family arsenosugar biosynthesis glycosyltransferase, partial [Burkholderiaceae bacterium]|nr:TIGR04283 family arsenosugar biosynthesis glycosyltransferase [Burkholderiaceae bacterium]